MRLLQNEDAASAALTELLSSQPRALEVFCALCAPEQKLSKQELRSLTVETQHRTDQNRRLDIIVHRGTFAIIVECKVGDRFKPYQLEHYKEYWEDKTGKTPHVVALVQKRQTIMGTGSRFARTITWNELADAFEASATDCPAIKDFRSLLDRSGVTLPKGKRAERQKIRKGYAQAHAERILLGVRDSIPGLVGDVHEVNECPPCLKSGRGSWKKHLLWEERAWLYLQPLEHRTNTVCPFGFVVHIALYHHGKRDTYSHVVDRLPHWAEVCLSHRLNLMRNVNGKWNRREFISPPFRTPQPEGLKWITAYAGKHPDEAFTAFDWRNEVEAITAGVRFLDTSLRIIDEFFS